MVSKESGLHPAPAGGCSLLPDLTGEREREAVLVDSRIDAATQLVGVIGWPVAHSLSPAMHNAALRHLDLNWRYVPLPVPPAMVRDAVRGIRALGFRGINVTVPHKQAVMELMDQVSPEAAALGAVNTIVVKRQGDGKAMLHGYNTDVPGFIGSLRAGGYDPAAGGRALVVGAGGAARAVVYALLTAGMTEVRILNRTLTRAEQLVADLHGAGIGIRHLEACVLDPGVLASEARKADLLVNATTVGMWPHLEESIWPDQVPLPKHLTVYDLVYNPLETRLLRHARHSGAKGIDGLGMLARQGALALALWLEEASPAPAGRGPEGAVFVEQTTREMRDICMQVLARRRETDG